MPREVRVGAAQVEERDGVSTGLRVAHHVWADETRATEDEDGQRADLLLGRV